MFQTYKLEFSSKFFLIWNSPVLSKLVNLKNSNFKSMKKQKTKKTNKMVNKLHYLKPQKPLLSYVYSH